MPSFLTRHGSNRLRKVKKTGDEGAAGRTESGGLGAGGTGGDPKSSLISFITVSNNSDSATGSLNKIQRSESFKRRFGLNHILTRGKNRTGTGQGIVSSQVGDIIHRPAGPGPGELGVGSKYGAFPTTSAQQQSSPINIVGTTTATFGASSRPSSRKLHKERPNPNNSPTRVIAPAIVPPAVSPVLSSPAEFSSQQQQDGMAATATMTSVMQQPKRRSFSLTLTVDELPRHITQASSSPPPQASRYNSYTTSSASPPTNENYSPMTNSASDPYSPLLASPVISKATSVGFSRPALVGNSEGLPQASASNSLNPTSSVELRGTIRTPVGYYITPSQTPTLLDRSDPGFNRPTAPTVVRPGPSTPPLTEQALVVSTAVAKVTNPTSHAQEGGPSGDRSFDNGPPTPASSNSSQKEKDPNRRVNFAEEASIPTGVVALRNNVGYYNPPQQNRFGNYRPPPGGRQFSNQSQHHGFNPPPFRGPPRGRLLLRGPPRPPSPIYVSPPSMKDHVWPPLKASQLGCSVGHSMIPFKNKQHSIVCTVCRAMEFEGRGEPVKRSFYCSWCAVRMCGDCKEELMEVCRGSLTELWDRTEEKREINTTLIKEGKIMEKRNSLPPVEQRNSESSELRWDAATDPVGDRNRSRTPQGILDTNTEDNALPVQRTPLRERPQHQTMIPQPQRSRTPPPKQLLAPPPQQSTALQMQQSRTPRPQQPGARRPQQLRAPQSQSRTPQRPDMGRQHSRTPQPFDQQQQPRQSNHGPPPPGNPNEYMSRQATPLSVLPSASRSSYPPSMPQLTPAETERYRLVTVPSNQKTPSSGTVVLVGEKQKEPSVFVPSLKGSVTKKKRNWLRGFGKKKDV